MKKIKCNSCQNIWIIEDNTLEKQKCCPFCASPLWNDDVQSEYDTLGKAIYGAYLKCNEMGTVNPHQLCGLMMDLAPQIRNKIHVFSRICIENKYCNIISLFSQDSESIKKELKLLRLNMTDNEGLSEKWADELADSIWEACEYISNPRLFRRLNMQVEDFIFTDSLSSAYPNNGDSQFRRESHDLSHFVFDFDAEQSERLGRSLGKVRKYAYINRKICEREKNIQFPEGVNVLFVNDIPTIPKLQLHNVSDIHTIVVGGNVYRFGEDLNYFFRNLKTIILSKPDGFKRAIDEEIISHYRVLLSSEDTEMRSMHKNLHCYDLGRDSAAKKNNLELIEILNFLTQQFS